MQMICKRCSSEIVPFEKYFQNGVGDYLHSSIHACKPIADSARSIIRDEFVGAERPQTRSAIETETRIESKLPQLAYRLEILRMLPGQKELDAWAADRQQIVSMLVNADQIFVYLLQIN